MDLKIYEYKQCGTCRKALKYLENKNISYQKIAIREQTPSKLELKKMLKAYEGDIKKIFNRSGQDYRAFNLKDKLATMSINEALDLLQENGNLVKRPFIIGKEVALVGFNEELWDQYL